MPTLDRDGVQIAYDVVPGPAKATPLLLTHGYGASQGMWRPNLSALAATRTVITWDMRGHGQTGSPPDPKLYSHEHTVDDMVAVLDACQIPVAAVGGLSLGGFMSLDFHRGRHPGFACGCQIFNVLPGNPSSPHGPHIGTPQPRFLRERAAQTSARGRHGPPGLS
jgi:Alpha/beta hydrolase family